MSFASEACNILEISLAVDPDFVLASVFACLMFANREARSRGRVIGVCVVGQKKESELDTFMDCFNCSG